MHQMRSLGRIWKTPAADSWHSARLFWLTVCMVLHSPSRQVRSALRPLRSLRFQSFVHCLAITHYTVSENSCSQRKINRRPNCLLLSNETQRYLCVPPAVNTWKTLHCVCTVYLVCLVWFTDSSAIASLRSINRFFFVSG
jgi:hypothetical protein